MKPSDIIGHLMVIVMALSGGYILLFRRHKVIEALLASNKEFWNKLNYNPNEGIQAIVANILIPFMGLCFLIAGIIALYKFVAEIFL